MWKIHSSYSTSGGGSGVARVQHETIVKQNKTRMFYELLKYPVLCPADYATLLYLPYKLFA